MFRFLLAMTVGVGLCSVLAAQQRPQVGYIYPPGGRAGESIDVVLGGYDFTPDTQFFVRDGQVKLEILGPPGEMIHPGPPHWFGPRAININKPFSVPREVPARLTIPEDVPTGVLRWQAANANGGSSTGTFVVTREPYEEVREESLPESRTLPDLPMTLSGRLEKKEEIDRFQLVAERTGLVTCVLPRLEITHPINPIVEVRDANGKRIADAADTEGLGLRLTFAVQAGETYTLTLHDLDLRGDRAMVYRLSLRYGPDVYATVPAAGPRGETRAVRFIGIGLATGKPRPESTVKEVTFPDGPDDTFTYTLKTPFGTAGIWEFPLSDLPERIEPALPGPGAITGLFNDSDEARYTLRLDPGDIWQIDAIATGRTSRPDLTLEVRDADGKTIASGTDLPNSTDSRLMLEPATMGEFTLIVRNLSGDEPGPATYRVTVTEPVPGFRLDVPEYVESIIGAEPVSIPKKPRGKPRPQPGVLSIDAIREGGFTGPITLTFEGLPDGITIPDENIIAEGETILQVPVTCGAEASSLATWVTVVASAEASDGSPIEKRESVLFVPVMKPLAVVRPRYPDAGRSVYRGATYPAPVVLERLDDYDGPVELQMAAVPDRVRQGIIGEDITVPPGVEEVEFPLFLPEWVQTDRTSRIVLNTVVTVPDALGRVRHLVNRMDRRITMNVEGALLKVTTDDDEFPLRQGVATIPVNLLRSPELTGDVRVSVIDTQDALLTAKSVTIGADDTTATLKLTANGPTPSDDRTVTIEARGHRDGHPVISRVEVVVYPSPNP